ncbi:TPA: hypothetical protein R4S16_003869 [Citrobacter amalonaticus]|nr:hypothetical protein [Citrobacter amalonaticus]
MKECSQESFYSWPLNDYYFMSGVRALSEALTTSGCETRYSFVRLDGYSLVSFIEQSPFRHRQNIVIITSRHLIPLASFWLTENSNICAVFGSTSSVKDVYNGLLNSTPGDKIIQPGVNVEQQLSPSDVRLLTYFLKGGNVHDLQNKYGNSRSTVTAWRKRILLKFGVRKTCHLFLEKKQFTR